MPKKIGWFFFDPTYKTVLLHRRDHRTEESPNMWDCFGGEIEKDEEPEKALIREIEEELDIRVPKNEIILLTSYEKFPVYYVHFHDWLTRTIRLGEGAGFAWFSFGHVFQLKDLHENARKALKRFQQKVVKRR